MMCDYFFFASLSDIEWTTDIFLFSCFVVNDVLYIVNSALNELGQTHFDGETHFYGTNPLYDTLFLSSRKKKNATRVFSKSVE